MRDPEQRHPKYDEMKPVWKLCRDASQGQRAIRAGGKEYLPELSGQTTAEYTAYLNRASWYPATGRTIEGMLGLVFRKDPVVTAKNETFKAWLKDITMSGISAEALATSCVEDVIKVGRYGLLVDRPPAPKMPEGSALTKAQEEQYGLRPYITPYTAEQILWWEHARVQNRTLLYRVCLEESYLDADLKAQPQIRELTIESGSYIQIVWRMGPDGWTVHDTIIPLKDGVALPEIPFWFAGPEETTGDVCDPPIEGLAEVNVSHFRNSADLEHGAHISGLPTAWFTCDDPKDAPTIYLGASTALALPTDSKVGFLTVGSEGFASLEKLMDRKEGQMAVLGARIIAVEKREAETAETTQTKKASETSVLANIARSVSKSMTKALQFVADWGGIAEQINFELNRDYLIMRLQAADITAIVAAWQGGAISSRTKFNAFKAGELIEETVTFDDEEEEIQNSVLPEPENDDPDPGENDDQ